MKYLLILFGFALLILSGCTTYDYEVCDNNGQCKRIAITNQIQPSLQTEKLCVADFEEAKKFGARSQCEDVPINRLLLKGGTDKPYCNGKYNNGNDFLDNWWNSDGLIDECEMPPESSMSFIFKQHDQSVRSHNGTIQVKIDVINYEINFKALQVFTGEDNNNDSLPDSWEYCGNVDRISVTIMETRVIQCSGANLKFVKLVNPPWNKGTLYIDSVEVLKD